MLRKGDLTQGGITGTLLHFTLPMMVGSFLQQCYNIADTLIVGQCIGAGALAAVGSAYTLDGFPYIRFAGTGDGQWHCVLFTLWCRKPCSTAS